MIPSPDPLVACDLLVVRESIYHINVRHKKGEYARNNEKVQAWRSQGPVAKLLGSISNRLRLDGGWIDQPFMSRLKRPSYSRGCRTDQLIGYRHERSSPQLVVLPEREVRRVERMFQNAI